MGASKRWIKAVLGLQKPNRSQSAETAENSSGSTEEIQHHRKHSDEDADGILENESQPSATTEVEDVGDTSLLPMKHSDIQDGNKENSQALLYPASSPTSLEGQTEAQLQQCEREQRAAIHIQAAFRRFVARRSMCAMRGLVRLQALATCHYVRKRAAITLHYMQDLVRVQARVQARRVRVGLENQIVQQRFQEQFEQESQAQVKETTDNQGGWCDRVGSIEDIKAKTEKKKEAAAKRERARAYALARQWQASSRHRVKLAGAGQDKFQWSWNWLDSWMAFSQWENRAIDVNLEDGKKPGGNEPAGAQPKPTARLISIGKKQITDTGTKKMIRSPSIRADITSEGKVSPHCSSPNKPVYLKETASPRTPTRSPRTVVKDLAPGSPSRFSSGQRSRSTPRERSPLADNLGKKRLSLPDSGKEREAQPAKQVSRPAVKRSLTAPKSMKTKSKTNGDNVTQSPQTAR